MTTTTVFDELRDALAELEFEGAAVGIDLGTTKSCVAVARFEDGEIVCECEAVDEPGPPEGQIAVPSVVAVKDGVAIVGHAAKRLARSCAATIAPRLQIYTEVCARIDHPCLGGRQSRNSKYALVVDSSRWFPARDAQTRYAKCASAFDDLAISMARASGNPPVVRDSGCIPAWTNELSVFH
ncbi:MAG: Hsp70 family protein [Rhodanobacteraceae bacterium]|nr:Hsp70 family protein [Rhodanobacteraceae bacterium]